MGFGSILGLLSNRVEGLRKLGGAVVQERAQLGGRRIAPSHCPFPARFIVPPPELHRSLISENVADGVLELSEWPRLREMFPELGRHDGLVAL